MDNRITIILELLSAGVIASLVAGIFSLVIAFKKWHESARNCGKRFTQSVWQQELNSHPKSVRIGHTF